MRRGNREWKRKSKMSYQPMVQGWRSVGGSLSGVGNANSGKVIISIASHISNRLVVNVLFIKDTISYRRLYLQSLWRLSPNNIIHSPQERPLSHMPSWVSKSATINADNGTRTGVDRPGN